MIIYVVHPYKGAGAPGERARNKARITAICRELIRLGHCPVSPVHALGAFLDDTDPEERALALGLCMILMKPAEQVWIFGDCAASEGGTEELKQAQRLRKPFRFVDEAELGAWGIVEEAEPCGQEH